ncbi:dynein, cytoplasmic 1, intermediate chain 2a-like [Clytia hemisphaerica]|uniref:Cytoplasmic dynein intermediate chain n=1 Tax=Clytia hemisphaerica TaxID=252671 RepID=A0A7M5XC25_9CNID|eukprot:TCONS_00066988-protein
MADRKAELDRKKKRLEEIRAQRNKNKPSAAASTSTSSPVHSSPKHGADATSGSDIDNLLKGLDLGTTPSASTPKSAPDTQPAGSEVKTTTTSAPTKSVTLSVSHREPVNVAPKELVSYEKGVQVQTIEEKDEPEPEPEIKTEEGNKDETDDKPIKKEETPQVVEMSDEAKQKILQSQNFAQFFDHAARIIEKAICEEDYAFDYGAIKDENEGDTMTSKKLALNRKFFDERWSKHRCVTCMDYSIQYPELLVASYNQNEAAPQDPDGVALVWNNKYNTQTPEYIFHNQSAIMSVCFAQFHPNLLVGGSYSGQIVLWDNRSRKRTPVQKTPLSASAHTHPVYCVEVVGTQNAHNLITFSTDGKMCSWSLDMLSQPQDVIDLQHTHSRYVAVTGASFQPGDVNNFVVGTEDGSVFSAQRHGTNQGLSEQFEGHHGPVTGINYNKVPGPIDFSHLFLTSSFDWTIKLWNNKSTKVLYSFEDNGDYVYDVEWSPKHPALFATVDGMGKLDLWNLNNDTEVPTSSVTVDPMAAINRVKWSGSGLQLAAGDDEGYIYIYDVGEQLALPRPDEWNRLVNTLQELQANQATVGDLERPLSPSSSLQSSLVSPGRI